LTNKKGDLREQSRGILDKIDIAYENNTKIEKMSRAR
jgi:hypothetical protein